MKKIIHGGDVYSYEDRFEKIIDFSSNINPLGIPENVKTALHDSVEKCIFYPDPLCRKLMDKLSKYYSISKDYIALGNGAADIIFKIAQTLKPKKAFLLAPTFSEYEISLKQAGTEINYYTLEEKNGFAVQNDFTDSIPEGTDIVYICNPNNPTGIPLEKENLLKILEECKKKGIVLVIDECFNDFMEGNENYSLVSNINDFNNLIILKAFTKMYAIPGVRLGYCISSDINIISDINNCGQAWSVSVFAQEAGLAALDDDEFVKETVKYISREREFLKSELLELGFTVYDSMANYIFFKNTYNCDIEDELKREGILIRSCSNYHELSDCYFRIAVKSHTDNVILIESLKKIIM